ncbi:partial xanthine dehydrogenase large subunit, partial [Methylacidimicrobium cyclopophantes]
VSEVEVDGHTGECRLLAVDILQDVGNSLNPTIDRGQVEGAFFQGIGWVLCEELLWDREGKLLTSDASTYKLPSASELPEHFEVRFLSDAAQPGVIGGSKAVGEPPLLLALSVREAIQEAIAAFGPGAVELGFPATPEQIYWAVEAARSRAKKQEG